jgi:hypothetical protein
MPPPALTRSGHRSRRRRGRGPDRVAAVDRETDVPRRSRVADVVDMDPVGVVAERERPPTQPKRQRAAEGGDDRAAPARPDEDRALRRPRAGHDGHFELHPFVLEAGEDLGSRRVVAERADERRRDAEPREGQRSGCCWPAARDGTLRSDDPIVLVGVARNGVDRVERGEPDAHDAGGRHVRLGGAIEQALARLGREEVEAGRIDGQADSLAGPRLRARVDAGGEQRAVVAIGEE